ncbi:discoidin, CUB and LCCL domain-containing protein 1-like isoform X2 [Sceloporus undulatus]|uniref:discoidin, CUB and LCCL domain-containing protein 1-like isoform X2 n=1 Tax=Sceloporus undulatus TaxID=8520 RepID=UPI001C4DA3A2|nr:discoidin, CUB and LCCL domain-containing protein 1-like isoform X2 [Sceloporus undulatus]
MMRSGVFLLLHLLLPYLHSSPAIDQKGNGCGYSVLTPYSGTLTSKNYPGTYPNFTFCEWRIHGAARSQFSLTFGDMDIEASEQCKSGFLLLSSPSSGSSFGPYCSSLNPPNAVLVMNSSINILFNSTVHRSGRGFFMSYARGNQTDLISCLQKGIHYDKKIIRGYCPAGCKGIAGDIWGNMNQGYRDTSVLCKAAIHAGVILDEQGGEITILREKGITLYESAFANGLYSKRGSLSEKRLIFQKACAGTLEIAGFNASSYWKEQNVMGENKSWTPDRAAFGVDGLSWAANLNSVDEWLEIDLGGRKNITVKGEAESVRFQTSHVMQIQAKRGIITKGSSHQLNYYVKSYQLLSSRDGKNWKVYKFNGGNEAKIFEGNNDSRQVVSNAFIPPILARYLRIIPQSWNQKIALKVALLGCQAARPKALRPYSDSGSEELGNWDFHSGPQELPVLTSSPAIFTEIPGIVISSEKTGPPLLVMLLIGGFVLICSALLLLIFLRHKKRKAAVDQDCGLTKDSTLMYRIPEDSQVVPGGSLQPSTSEVTSFHGAGMPVDVGKAQPPEYAEPDVVQVSQTAPLTFKPVLDEGYTLPLIVNHYDVPSKYHEYAEPLPPEPEYATPFTEPATQPEGDTFRKNISVIKPIPSSKSLSGGLPSLRCSEAQMQYDFPIQRPAEKLDSKVAEVDLQEGSIETGSMMRIHQ